MTVAELIAALSRFNPSTKVVVRGFDECGTEDPHAPYLEDDVVMIDFAYPSELDAYESHLDKEERNIRTLEALALKQRGNDSVIQALIEAKGNRDRLEVETEIVRKRTYGL